MLENGPVLPLRFLRLGRLSRVSISSALLWTLSTVAHPLPAEEAQPLAVGVELTPLFPEGRLAQAKKAFDLGNATRALELLEDQGDAQAVRYLRGLAATRARRFELAAEELRSVADSTFALRDLARVEAANALAAVRRWDEARALLEGLPPESCQYRSARLALARLHEQRGALADAVAVLEALSPQRPDTLQELLRLAKRTKQPELERHVLQTLWAEHPRAAEGLKLNARQMATAPLEVRTARAERLVELHRSDQALREARAAMNGLSLPHPLACRLRTVEGKVYRKERQHDLAIAALTPVVAQCTEPELRVQALFVLASSQSIVAPADGLASYERLLAEFPDHPFADDALFYAADLDLELGAIERARSRLEQLGREHPTGRFAAEAAFRRFWLEWRAGTPERGFDALDLLAGLGSPDRARYWRARSFEVRGEKQKALESLFETATEHPATYYGQLALGRLRDVDPLRARLASRQLKRPAETSSPPAEVLRTLFEAEPLFAQGVTLLRMGLPGAEESLLGIDFSRLGPQAGPAVFQVLDAFGLRDTARRIPRSALRASLAGSPNALNWAVWETLHPGDYGELLERQATSVGLEGELLRALVRQESGFSSRAKSPVGALGLMQLMPTTARAVARRLNLPFKSPRQLLDPQENARLGAAYLSQLVETFDNELVFAVAGYNAGPNRVHAWRKAQPELSLDEWVEEIPIAETRHYVQSVLGGYGTYRLLRTPSGASALLSRGTPSIF